MSEFCSLNIQHGDDERQGGAVAPGQGNIEHHQKRHGGKNLEKHLFSEETGQNANEQAHGKIQNQTGHIHRTSRRKFMPYTANVPSLYYIVSPFASKNPLRRKPCIFDTVLL